MARKKGLTRNLHSLKILTEEQIELIHKNTLDVLQKTGARFESKKALKLFKENPDAFDLLLTDMTMPKMTGDVLAINVLSTPFHQAAPAPIWVFCSQKVFVSA